MENLYKTTDVCKKVGVSKNSLLKWLREGFIDEPAQRTIYEFLWSKDNISNIEKYMKSRIRKRHLGVDSE